MTAARVRVLLSLLLLSLVIAPIARAAQKARPALDAHEQAFMAQAASDDALQIELAKLAMAKSANPRVRVLASKIISDHAALNLQFARLAAATRGKGHAYRAPAPRGIKAMKARLRALQGDAFDQAFVAIMIKEHRKIIAAYDAAAKTSADTRLQTIAARGIPVLQDHLDGALALSKEGSLAQAGRMNK